MEGIATELAVEDAVRAITSVVATSAYEEIRLIWGFKDWLLKLKKKFDYFRALLNDLEKVKNYAKTTSRVLNFWLQEVKEVAYSAENVLDDHADEMLRRKIELKASTSFKKKCGSYMRPSTSPIVFRIRMTRRVNQILSKLDQLEKMAVHIGLGPVLLVREAVSSSAASTSVGDVDWLSMARKHASAIGSNFIGRDRDKRELLHKLLDPRSNESGLSIIAIVGIGGLGKTTLAHQLYHHTEVLKQFGNRKVWSHVAKDFDVDKILKEMVEEITLTNCDLMNTDSIDEALVGEKLFLVLDDVWNEDEDLWDLFKTKLQRIGGLNRSVILITTRILTVANKARASYLHDLQGLSEQDGWELLKQEVFGVTKPCDPSLVDVGRKIVKKCRGVPLAIKSIGGLLRSKHVSEWESIESNELWNIPPHDSNYVMSSLFVSYNHINHVYVKQCFAYCAIFPKDSVMEKDQLIALWLAQGLIHDEFETGNLSAIKDTIDGDKCFDILIKHSFLQKESESEYKMNGLVHDLATYVSKKDLFVWKGGINIEDVDSHIRHLAINLKENETALGTLAEDKLRKLMTVSFWHGIPRWNWNTFICARYMRTLVIAGFGLREIPSVIEQLAFLRYLDLSANYNIEALPESICKLYQLQTLRLLECDGIRELPGEFHRLENLRHIKTSHFVLASKGLRNLKCLQTLPRLKLRDGEGWTINELGPLDHVKGGVYISGLEHVKNKEEAREASIGTKLKILKLELSWGLNNEVDNDEDVLDGLEPHPNMQSISIEGFNGLRFPRWIATMSVKQGGNRTYLGLLKEVILIDCKRCQQLPSLGQLPYLMVLRLKGFDNVKCIGDEFYEDPSNTNAVEIPVADTAGRKELFPALRELHIESFKRLTTWMSPSPALVEAILFPSLETLEIRYCWHLETVPYIHFQSLKRLVVTYLSGSNPLDIIKGSNEMKFARC